MSRFRFLWQFIRQYFSHLEEKKPEKEVCRAAIDGANKVAKEEGSPPWLYPCFVEDQ